MDILQWIEKWYLSNCNGAWEHEFGIKIDTVDNPGWYITIDLHYTSLEDYEFDMDTVEESDDNWYFFVVKEGQFKASGDPSKLGFLLEKFRKLVESRNLS